MSTSEPHVDAFLTFSEVLSLTFDLILRKRKKTAAAAAADDDGPTNPSAGGGPANKKRSAKLVAQRAQMRDLLAQPLVARGISMKYLTSGSKSVVDELITSSSACFFSLRLRLDKSDWWLMD